MPAGYTLGCTKISKSFQNSILTWYTYVVSIWKKTKKKKNIFGTFWLPGHDFVEKSIFYKMVARRGNVPFFCIFGLLLYRYNICNIQHLNSSQLPKGLLWIRVNGWWFIWFRNICQSTIGIEWRPRYGDFPKGVFLFCSQ